MPRGAVSDTCCADCWLLGSIALDRLWWIPAIVVPLVLGLVLLILEYRTKWFARSLQSRKDKDSSLGQSSDSLVVGVPESDPGTISVSPSEIVGELERLPPYQRPKAADYYRGLRVEWKVALQSISLTGRKGTVLVIATTENEIRGPWLTFKVNILKYPELRIAKKGKEFWVAGQISEVGGLTIQLSSCVLRFD